MLREIMHIHYLCCIHLTILRVLHNSQHAEDAGLLSGEQDPALLTPPSGQPPARPRLLGHAARPLRAPAPGAKAHAQSSERPSRRAGGCGRPFPLPSSRTQGTRRRGCFGCGGRSSRWTVCGMSWPLPFLVLPCFPFLTSPTTWCRWWHWSISRVSAGRRGPAPSGCPSPRGRPERGSGRAAPRPESCSRAGGAPRGGPSDPSSTGGENEARAVLAKGGAGLEGVRGRPTAAGGTPGTGDRAAAAAFGSPGLPASAQGLRCLLAVPPVAWKVF